jgi:hypothetical protein
MILLRVMLLAGAVGGPALPSQEGPVWFWFTSCGGPAMNLEVRLDQKVLYKSSFPLCRAERSSVHSQGQARKLHFVFRPRRAIVWQGYREEDDTTDANQRIEGDIWLAGADPDALLMGISFSSHDSIYLNTIHIAHPARRDQSEVASGLVVITNPVGLRKEKSK